jgi:hypothetical protein
LSLGQGSGLTLINGEFQVAGNHWLSVKAGQDGLL